LFNILIFNRVATKLGGLLFVSSLIHSGCVYVGWVCSCRGVWAADSWRGWQSRNCGWVLAERRVFFTRTLTTTSTASSLGVKISFLSNESSDTSFTSKIAYVCRDVL